MISFRVESVKEIYSIILIISLYIYIYIKYSTLLDFIVCLILKFLNENLWLWLEINFLDYEFIYFELKNFNREYIWILLSWALNNELVIIDS